MKCPKCGNDNIHIESKGLSSIKGILGYLLTGGKWQGFVAGSCLGASKQIATCMNCGKVFAPKTEQAKIVSRERAIEDYKRRASLSPRQRKWENIAIVFFVLMFILPFFFGIWSFIATLIMTLYSYIQSNIREYDVKMQIDIDENDTDEEIKRKIIESIPPEYKDKKICDIDEEVKRLKDKLKNTRHN